MHMETLMDVNVKSELGLLWLEKHLWDILVSIPEHLNLGFVLIAPDVLTWMG